MLAFFYSLFYSIIRGEWVLFPYQDVTSKLTDLTNRTINFIVNALGGNFETLQTITFVDEYFQPTHIIALVLAVISIVLVCTIAFKLVKMVFSIFFGGR